MLGLPLGEIGHRRDPQRPGARTSCASAAATACPLPRSTSGSAAGPSTSSGRTARLVVETDGYLYHRGAVAFEDDHDRDLGLRGSATTSSASPRRRSRRGTSASPGCSSKRVRVTRRRARRRVAPMAEDNSTGALPPRRQLARLPGLLRAAGVDRDRATAARPTRSTGSPRCWSRSSTSTTRAASSSPGTRGCPGARSPTTSTRRSANPRPDLLREQWPHLMPLVEAFGYTNVKVEGYEADDVIATLAVRAREEGIPVMVVTGDRDAYQLVGDGIRVMSTSRGDHRDQGLRPRGGDRALRRAARAGHRPDGPARRHLRQHPRRPRHRREDRRPAAAEVRHPRGRARQRRGGLRRQTQAEPGRARRRRPHVEAARDAAVRPRDRGRPAARRWRPSPTAAPCASSCASSSCAP